MKNIVEKVKNKMIQISEDKFKETGLDNWNIHIKLVYESAHNLALERNADVEIVDLSAILHDVARVMEYGPIEEHNIYGAEVAEKILNEYNYPKDRIELVKKCILNHNFNPKESVEEQIVADADVLAHFDDLSTFYYIAYVMKKLNIDDAKRFVRDKLEFDYKKLSNYGKEKYKDRYDNIIKVLFVSK